ncbi:hypothetical protein SDC9_191295 [bioreactor metagenome]|uniref:Uncharacterized protein n=1 Tax=bioreactor metagenome TaxID=1076179 RepID=A0A645HXH5_9ZZZZ
MALCNLIQFVFHVGGKLYIYYFMEVLFQQIYYCKTQFGGLKLLIYSHNITAGDNGLNNCRVGTGSANPFFLEYFNQ